MIDGTYDIKAKTPLGKKSGRLVLTTNDTQCEASLEMLNKKTRSMGTVDGDNLVFTGTVNLPFPLGKVNYELTGTVKGDDLEGVFKSKKFTFDVTGIRVA